MIFLRVLPKIFMWPHYSGPQELGGPGSLNRLNPRFLRHCLWLSKVRITKVKINLKYVNFQLTILLGLRKFSISYFFAKCAGGMVRRKKRVVIPKLEMDSENNENKLVHQRHALHIHQIWLSSGVR